MEADRKAVQFVHAAAFAAHILVADRIVIVEHKAVVQMAAVHRADQVPFVRKAGCQMVVACTVVVHKIAGGMAAVRMAAVHNPVARMVVVQEVAVHKVVGQIADLHTDHPYQKRHQVSSLDFEVRRHTLCS